ncbi:MAG: DUF4430 domain-containing protein [Clostridiales bacterium]|nr:DUF4430 domain-containing protein [Clostridiales bacterium]
MKYKSKIITVVVILAALAGAWFYGGNYNVGESDMPPALALAEAGSGSEAAGAPEAGAESAGKPAVVTADAQVSAPVDADTHADTDADADADTDTDAPKMEIDLKTGKDKYLTDPVPEGKPLPVEPQNMAAGDESFTVTISVRCDTILSNMNLLNKEKYELVPDDGIIFPDTEVTAYEGESVFNVFQREMKRAKIHMSFRNTPIYNSAYILDVNNLYEFDTGELSGWMYKVNGWFPNYGCSRYKLNPGDVIEWVYTCDLGRDVGGGWIAGLQIDD